MSATLRVRNWSKFQHYKGRRPPWIKLHRGLLDDYAFSCLPLASRALAPYVWLLASESEDGTITASAEELAFRLRCAVSDVVDGLTGLISGGFVDGEIVASNMLADCKQHATPDIETEKETDKRKKRTALAIAAPTALAEKRPGNWVGEAMDLWPGVIAGGRVGKALSPVVQKYGAAETLSGLKRWLEAGNAKFGPEVFATDAESWIVGDARASPKAQKLDDLVLAGVQGGLRGK